MPSYITGCRKASWESGYLGTKSRVWHTISWRWMTEMQGKSWHLLLRRLDGEIPARVLLLLLHNDIGLPCTLNAMVDVIHLGGCSIALIPLLWMIKLPPPLPPG